MGDFTSLLKQKLDQLNTLDDKAFNQEFNNVEQFVNEGIQALPPYSLKQVDDMMKPFRERAKKAKAPKSFAFKKEVAKLDELDNAAKKLAGLDKAPEAKREALADVSFPTLLDNAELYGGKDVAYRDLSNEIILIKVHLSALTLVGLKNCKVYCLGIIRSSLVMRDCVDCEIHCRTSQCRIHGCKVCSLYLFTLTDPIIENCSNMCFGPFNMMSKDKFTQDDESFTRKESNRYAVVRDFNWLKPQQSPNWQLIPPKQTIESESVASLGLSFVD